MSGINLGLLLNKEPETLGKIIGVYLGRPFEQWSHERIMEELGEINYYVNEQLNVPLVVTDGDITGTFTFLRALRENNFDPNISAKQIGQTWLNNLIENKTVKRLMISFLILINFGSL